MVPRDRGARARDPEPDEPREDPAARRAAPARPREPRARRRLRPRRPRARARFDWDGLAGTLAALAPAVRRRGHVVVGEPYWRRWPLPDGVSDQGFVSLAETVASFDAAGLRLVSIIAASEDDWDRYESLHWRSLEEWLAEHADDPDAGDIRARHEEYRDRYLRVERDLLGWAIFAGWKR